MKDVLRFFANVTILVLFSIGTLGFDNCTTPDNIQGVCIRLNNCKQVRDLARKKPPTNNDRMFLRQSQCDVVENYPWVCCPVKTLVTTRRPKEATLKTQIIYVEDSSLLLNPKVCGTVARNLEDRIFGGYESSLGEFPWMALLVYEKKNQKLSFGCGGALITSKFVLTAAHCVIKELLPITWKLSKVRLGEWDRATNPDCQQIDRVTVCAPDSIDVNIAAIHPHENYQHSSSDKLHDIAMLRLELAVEYSEFVRPICLPLNTLDKSYKEFGSGIVTGFGKTETESSSQRMLKVELDIVDHLTCKRKYRVQGRLIHDSQICAIKYHADTCNGDSGSPFMRQSDTYPSFWYLIGITSFGPSKCGATDYPGVYTSVENYIEWIKATINL